MTTSPVVPETVKLEVSTAIPPSRLTSVLVVAPRPVTVANVSASEERPAVVSIVIVDPDVVTFASPEPLIVREPARLLTSVTIAVVSKETVGL